MIRVIGLLIPVPPPPSSERESWEIKPSKCVNNCESQFRWDLVIKRDYVSVYAMQLNECVFDFIACWENKFLIGIYIWVQGLLSPRRYKLLIT